MSRKIIITTTINKPTEATKKFAKLNDWDFLIVGDTKTPHEEYKNYNYLHPEDQEKLDKTLSDIIGWKSIQRRNMGFLYALKNGYDYIATVDDDNIPYDNWGEFFKPQEIDVFSTKFNFFDPLSVTNYNHLWHRGFPLQHVHKKNEVTQTKKFFEKFDVQANLWDGDPDIDAICRMIYSPECKFNNSWYTTTNLTPFNSQNTILSKKALEHYYMFDKVGRMDDIFGSYILQKKGFNVVFGPSTVYQDRNVHDLTIDMKKEYIGYENVKNIIEDESFIPMDGYNRYREVVTTYKK
jgi:hypothetical protein